MRMRSKAVISINSFGLALGEEFVSQIVEIIELMGEDDVGCQAMRAFWLPCFEVEVVSDICISFRSGNFRGFGLSPIGMATATGMVLKRKATGRPRARGPALLRAGSSLTLPLGVKFCWRHIAKLKIPLSRAKEIIYFNWL